MSTSRFVKLHNSHLRELVMVAESVGLPYEDVKVVYLSHLESFRQDSSLSPLEVVRTAYSSTLYHFNNEYKGGISK